MPASGTEFRDCEACPTMVALPQHEFIMGSPDAEREFGREKTEGPQHPVQISYPLAVSKHEITFAEWDACATAGGCNRFRPHDQGRGRGSLPVSDVSWLEARGYTAWLSYKSGKSYRLPSEAEWEYAARAGTGTRYWWGEKPRRDRANFGKDTCCGGHSAGLDKWVTAAPVGSFPANAFGLHDMLGNLWEWVEDCWQETYDHTPVDGSPAKTGNCDRRVMRGGSWGSLPIRIRAAFRDAFPPDDRGDFIGFRVARSE